FYWYNPSRLPTPAEWVTIRRTRVKDAVNVIWWLSKSENPRADNRRVLRPYSRSMRRLLKDGYKAARRPSQHDIGPHFRRDNGGALPPNILTLPHTRPADDYLPPPPAPGPTPHPPPLPPAPRARQRLAAKRNATCLLPPARERPGLPGLLLPLHQHVIVIGAEAGPLLLFAVRPDDRKPVDEVRLAQTEHEAPVRRRGVTA